MGDILPDDLVARIRARLADDWRRTGDGDWQRTPAERRRRSEGSDHPLAGMLDQLMQTHGFSGASAEPPKPVVPLDEKAVAKVEGTLGFSLPAALRQLYREIGDGNFGPFNGIRRLSNWAKDYAKLRADMPAERGRDWPETLLPLVYLNGKRVCLDRQSGAVVLWTKPPKKASEKKWLASFVPQAASLAEWLERWVDVPTWCEGGPEGGWTPPGEEVARREAVEGQKEARQAAERNRAQRIAHTELPPLSSELLGKMQERAFDPARRTDLSAAAARSQPLDIGRMAHDIDSNPHLAEPARRLLGSMAQGIDRLSGLLGSDPLRVLAEGAGLAIVRSDAGGVLGAPADARAIAAAEASLGFALPAPLHQLYAIADGGFGPGDQGFWPLDRMTAEYRKLTAQPQGPNEEPWPAKLLPLFAMDPALGCLDLETGAIVVHDVQLMDHLGPGQWRRSFVAGQADLAGLLDDWLAAPEHGMPGG